ncbi:glutamate synthase [Rhizobium sp. Root73]|uniref:FAD-dependent oxidoreductase n=1 Tax=unclassified Rhizobium TaxID=2613769 RepID=UPI000714C179|nr:MULTISPECIES: NAD(P)/FAD-dependent oxidoreductase [unclassified Rhizobium]KQV29429.1 glutamate synthase [Rhizobium sp. Root1204]KQY05350.1 glutamate synthase [Rhizobium sp. Root1334]KRC01966.1 glutamate synthase [Rhizobium sp. Root73]
MKQLDIGVVGAGPAGLAAALFLSRAGHRVEILERFETAAPVGSGLLMQPTGLTVLATLGLFDTIQSLGNRIDRLHGADAISGRTVLDVRYDATPGGRYGLAVQRAALFNTLHDAVVADGIITRTATHITATEQRADRVILQDATRRAAGDYDLVIDASGARSMLAAGSTSAPAIRDLTYGAFWATLDGAGAVYDRTALSQRYDQARVMIGLLPAGRATVGDPDKVAFFWSLKIADVEAVKAGGLNRWKTVIGDYWPECQPFLDQIHDWDQLTLARYAHRTALPPYSGNVVFIGDSAHSTSPQLGQGANMALLDAAALNHALANSADIPSALTAYARARRNHVRLFQMLSLAFTPFYQSDSAAIAWVRDRLVSTIAKLPPMPGLLAAIVAGTVIDPFKSAGLTEYGWLSLPYHAGGVTPAVAAVRSSAQV